MKFPDSILFEVSELYCLELLVWLPSLTPFHFCRRNARRWQLVARCLRWIRAYSWNLGDTGENRETGPTSVKLRNTSETGAASVKLA